MMSRTRQPACDRRRVFFVGRAPASHLSANRSLFWLLQVGQVLEVLVDTRLCLGRWSPWASAAAVWGSAALNHHRPCGGDRVVFRTSSGRADRLPRPGDPRVFNRSGWGVWRKGRVCWRLRTSSRTTVEHAGSPVGFRFRIVVRASISSVSRSSELGIGSLIIASILTG